ncbi:hypothetical protein RN001_013911 [Aquatica leii]|uniref:Uncharacterized protein n=1 Tax=Aquatica leii TaxID=1421715 RepID=A0AAN7P533_9COLE|nr:hypothetical protein RN001_013911 [Aquatica leii]
MKLCTAITVILCIIHAETKCCAKDYCWRDFNGGIPSDAFPAGVDKNGKPIYVGHVTFPHKVINGQIFSDKNVIYYDWLWKEYSSDKNIKILCTEQPQKFEWVPISYNEVLFIQKKLLIGGFDDYPTYIGRAQCDNETSVGKIICIPSKCFELFTTQHGYTKEHEKFEILTYNPSINSTNKCDIEIELESLLNNIAITVILCIIHAETKYFAEDYCWRDFNGAIPSDAFPAGVDKNGKPIYVGQVLFQDKLINGQIFSDKNVIYFDWLWKEYSSDKNIKILCTEQPQKFEWVPTCYNEVLFIQKILVPGGFEDYPTYIGRAQCDNEKRVGKIICKPTECFELFTTQNGYTKGHEKFEILTYNPSINSTNKCDIEIDVRRGN